MLEVPQALLDERRSKGLDRSDEMWEGELHLVSPPSGEHQARGLLPRYDPTGLFRPGVDDDWRVPDQQYARPELASKRGIEGAASLVVEILSPHDETFANQDGRMVPVEPVLIECLGVRAETVDGKLRLAWEGGTAEI